MAPGKKDPQDIIKAIFGDLSGGGLKSLSEIATDIGSHNYTVKKYTELIEFIQNQPRIIVEHTKALTLARLEKKEKEKE
jgi:hypothetical protein